MARGRSHSQWFVAAQDSYWLVRMPQLPADLRLWICYECATRCGCVLWKRRTLQYAVCESGEGGGHCNTPCVNLVKEANTAIPVCESGEGSEHCNAPCVNLVKEANTAMRRVWIWWRRRTLQCAVCGCHKRVRTALRRNEHVYYTSRANRQCAVPVWNMLGGWVGKVSNIPYEYLVRGVKYVLSN